MDGEAEAESEENDGKRRLKALELWSPAPRSPAEPANPPGRVRKHLLRCGDCSHLSVLF